MHTWAHTPHTCGVALTEIGGSCLLCPSVCLGSLHRPPPRGQPLSMNAMELTFADCCTGCCAGIFFWLWETTPFPYHSVERLNHFQKVLWNKCFYESSRNERWVTAVSMFPAPWPLPTDKHRILHFVQGMSWGWEWWFTDFRGTTTQCGSSLGPSIWEPWVSSALDFLKPNLSICELGI